MSKGNAPRSLPPATGRVFTVTDDITRHTKAKIFSAIGKATLKEGNFGIIGNNAPALLGANL